DCFSVIVSAEDVTVGKPDPQGYLMTADLVSQKIKRGLQASDCLIVEDAPTVTRSVRQVGFPVLAVTTSHSADKFGEANWVVGSLRPEEVQRVLPGLRI